MGAALNGGHYVPDDFLALKRRDDLGRGDVLPNECIMSYGPG